MLVLKDMYGDEVARIDDGEYMWDDYEWDDTYDYSQVYDNQEDETIF